MTAPASTSPNSRPVVRRLVWRATIGVFVAWLSVPAVEARAADECAGAAAAFTCAPVPTDPGPRQRALEALDRAGRAAVAAHDAAAAVEHFGCLLREDPTAATAGNLAVVLRETNRLDEAVAAARCAETLAAPGPVRDRARQRREEIEQRRAESAPPAPATPPAAITAVAPPPAAPVQATPSRPWAPLAFVTAAVAATGAGVLYVLARDRAGRFETEQTEQGYTARARELRGSAQSLRTASLVSLGVGLATGLTGMLLVRF